MKSSVYVSLNGTALNVVGHYNYRGEEFDLEEIWIDNHEVTEMFDGLTMASGMTVFDYLEEQCLYELNQHE